MTSKELNYIDDALAHEKHFSSQCKQAAQQLQDSELKSCVEQMATKHDQIYSNLLNLL